MQAFGTNGLPTKDRLVGFSEVEAITSLTRSSIYRYVRAGRFPRPLKVAGRTMWSALDLDQWIEAMRQHGGSN